MEDGTFIREQIRAEIRQLAVRCVHAELRPESIIHALVRAINQERTRLLVEATGFVSTK